MSSSQKRRSSLRNPYAIQAKQGGGVSPRHSQRSVSSKQKKTGDGDDESEGRRRQKTSFNLSNLLDDDDRAVFDLIRSSMPDPSEDAICSEKLREHLERT